MKAILFFIFCHFINDNCIAQLPEYNVNAIINNAIVNPFNVSQIIRDKKGFLWLLSATRVQRFDGATVKSFSFTDRCFAFQEDDSGKVWVVCENSVYQFQNDYSGFAPVDQKITGNRHFRSVIHGPDGRMYFLANNGIYVYDENERKITQTDIPVKESVSSFPFLKSAGQSIFYKYSNYALARYNFKTGVLDTVPMIGVNKLVVINEDSVWAKEGIGNTELVSFKTRRTTPIVPSQFEIESKENTFTVLGGITDSIRHVYLVELEDKGFYFYDPAVKEFKPANLLYQGTKLHSGTLFYNFYEEKNGLVWLTNAEGLFYFNPYAFGFGLCKSDNETGKGWNNDVRNITEDEEGNIWFATANGFCKWDFKNDKIQTWLPQFNNPGYLNYSSIRSIAFANGKLIIGQSEGGFWIFNPAQNSFARPGFEHTSHGDSLRRLFQEDFNSNIYQLRKGNFFLFERRLWILDKNDMTINQVIFDSSLALPRISGGYEDNFKRIWLLSEASGSIYVLDSNFKKILTIANPAFRNWLSDIVQVDDETFWATSKTLFEIKWKQGDPPTVRPILPELKNVHLSHIFKDSLNRLWMFNEQGMYLYSMEKKILRYFNKADNVQGFAVRRSNSFRARNGMLYAGSTSGINYFTPEKISLEEDSLKTYILDISVNGDDSSWLLGKMPAQLSYHQNSMVFDFATTYLQDAAKIQYRYMLVGIDKNWVSNGNNHSIRLTSLQPGDYTFRIAASLNRSDWYESPQPIHFIIKPPYWQTWWFRSLCILSAIVLVLFIINYFRLKQKKQRDAAVNERKMTESRLQNLRLQMNPHFLFNALNSAQQMILAREDLVATAYLSRFSKLLRSVLMLSDKESISLKEEIEIIKMYVELESIRFKESFSYQVVCSSDIETEEIKIPTMLIQAFIENAIWHGLMHKENNRRLLIEFKEQGNYLLCTVEDNGIGRKRAAALKLQTGLDSRHKSRGIDVSVERLKSYTNDEGLNGKTEFADLTDEQGNPSGTRVTLYFPI